MPFQHPQILNLDELNVYHECDPTNPMFFNIADLPEILTYGKHYFKLSFNDPESTNLQLKESSTLSFEFKDSQGQVIFSDITNQDSIDGSSVCYVWVRDERSAGYYGEIADGVGIFTITGELENVPKHWVGKHNVRLSIPIEIRKNLPNISPILFQSSSLIQTSINFSESIETDTNDSNYKRSYINVSASNLQTFGGKLSSIELSYNETRAKNNEYKILTTYPLSSSVYESDLTETGGLNPISDLQKFPMPRDLRRNGNVEFRLKFLNANGEYAQDISQNNVDVTITGSISNFTGSAVILETTDNLVTGSGAFIFGKDVDNGIRMDFKPTGEGNVKDSDTIEFTRVVAGVDNKAIYALSDKGEIINDIETNKVSGSISSAIIGTVDGAISSSNLSSLIATSGSSIIGSPLSTIFGGTNQLISHSLSNTTLLNNSIVGGSSNTISSTTTTITNNTILGGVSHKIHRLGAGSILAATIIGGRNAEILDGFDSTIIGGYLNDISASRSAIIGGQSNKVLHNDSVIIGMTSKTSAAANTVYVENLDVDGTITANEFHTTYTSASIIYASGSTQFGDTLDDTHNFTGSVNITGSLTLNGDSITAGGGGSSLWYDGTTYLSSSIGVRVEGDISASGDLDVTNISSSANIYAPNIGSGTDNSVVILDSDGTFKTDEINPKVWDSDTLLNSVGLSSGYIPVSDNGNEMDNSNLYWDSNKLGIGTGAVTPSKTLTVNGDISGSGELNIQGNITASNIAGTLTTPTQDNISQIYNTSLKIGRDSQNLIDFATVDNNIIFRINNADELKLLFNSLQPYTSNGLALGSTSNQWSDLYLYEGGVINWDNGDVTITQTGNQLDIEGTTLTTFEGDISGSGQVYAVSASFGELSNTTNRWTDGSNGNDEFIAITPSDFALTDAYSRGDEFPHYTDDNGGSIRPSSAGANYFALKMIPKGFTAIEVYIYSDSSDTITVYEGNIANATATSKGSGNTNTTINITDVDGDGTNYLSIKWNPSSTLDNIYGGKINIQRTT